MASETVLEVADTSSVVEQVAIQALSTLAIGVAGHTVGLSASSGRCILGAYIILEVVALAANDTYGALEAVGAVGDVAGQVGALRFSSDVGVHEEGPDVAFRALEGGGAGSAGPGGGVGLTIGIVVGGRGATYVVAGGRARWVEGEAGAAGLALVEGASGAVLSECLGTICGWLAAGIDACSCSLSGCAHHVSDGAGLAQNVG